MKKTLLFFVVAAMFSMTTFAQTATKRTVLFEEFTNASCAPCAFYNPGMHAVATANEDKLITIKYQVNYPGFDPMNVHNPSEAKVRHDYYAVTGVPAPFVDGRSVGPSAFNQNAVNTAYIRPVPYDVKVTHRFTQKYDSIFARVVIKNISVNNYGFGNERLHIALVEKSINYAKAPGSNGEKDFHSVMRKMLPNASGTTLKDTLKAGDSLVVNVAAALPKYIYGLEEMAVVAFAQNQTTKVIQQANISEPLALNAGNTYVDLATTSSTVRNVPPCGAEFTPKIIVKNVSDDPITSFDAAYTLNGAKSAKIPWTGELKKGESATVEFPIAQVVSGKANPLAYTIDNVNGGAAIDKQLLNNQSPSEVLRVLPAAATAKSLVATFEGALGGFPSNAVLFSNNPDAGNFAYYVDQAVTSAANAPQPLGGFAKSKSSMRFRFTVMSNIGEKIDMTFNKLNLTDMKSPSLKFDYAYTQAQLTTGVNGDKFEVLVTKDCGATYKTVFSKEKEDLTTTPGVTAYNKVFYPIGTDWKQENIDLKEFAGEGEVIVILRGTSGNGNNLYLDNVTVTENTIGTAEPELENATLDITPNPANDYAYINVNFEENTEASVRIFDITGKQIATLAQNQAFGAGAYQLRWDANVQQGIYIVKIETAKGQLTKRVSIMK